MLRRLNCKRWRVRWVCKPKPRVRAHPAPLLDEEGPRSPNGAWARALHPGPSAAPAVRHLISPRGRHLIAARAVVPSAAAAPVQRAGANRAPADRAEVRTLTKGLLVRLRICYNSQVVEMGVEPIFFSACRLRWVGRREGSLWLCAGE